MCKEPDQESLPSSEGSRSRRAEHAQARQAEGRPVGAAFNDVQRARQVDVFVQTDGRYVVRGSRGREHIFDPDGTHITTVRRSQSAHESKIARGERQPIAPEAFARWQEKFR